MPENKSLRSSFCLCCSSELTIFDWGIISPFISHRVFSKSPEKVKLFRCRECGFSWSEQGFTPDQAMKLYKNYRGADYFRERNHFEPWYTKAKNADMSSEQQMAIRRSVMNDMLNKANKLHGDRPTGLVVDFGGDRGQMLRDLPDNTKLVYEVSGVESEEWAKKINDTTPLTGKCDLVIACQVLEHVDDPISVAKQISSLVHPGGWIYLEVPDEQWQQSGTNFAWRKNWLNYVVLHPLLVRILDFLSIAARIKTKKIPFFGFWSLREHLNFYTKKSLLNLAKKIEIQVILVAKNSSGISMICIRSTHEK